jgi:hypothetical protein
MQMLSSPTLADEQVIVAAVNSGTTDQAALLLQTALGIKSGDVAAQCFPDQDKWATMSMADRCKVIGEYLSAEACYAYDPAEDAH